MEEKENAITPTLSRTTQLPQGYLDFMGEWVAADGTKLVVTHMAIILDGGLMWFGLVLTMRLDGVTVYPIPSFWDKDGKNGNSNLNISRARRVDAYGDKAQW